jgi:hypothetical protein
MTCEWNSARSITGSRARMTVRIVRANGNSGRHARDYKAGSALVDGFIWVLIHPALSPAD